MPQAISNLCLQPDETVADAARILEQNPQKICFVVKEDVLLGTITDGDIRRSCYKAFHLMVRRKKL